MIRFLLIAAVALLAGASFMPHAQVPPSKEEKAEVRRIVADWVADYNAARYADTRKHFSDQMKQALPEKDIVEWLEMVHSQLGKVDSFRYKDGNIRDYRYILHFGRQQGMMLLVVNDKMQLEGLQLKPYTDAPAPSRNSVTLRLPFKGFWTVAWGGPSAALNHHYNEPSQRQALDLVMTLNGKTYKGDGTKNEDYFCYNQPLLAAADAEVVTVVDGIPDNIPGETDPTFVTGNTIVLKIAENEYLLYAHLKPFSATVKPGQRVKAGQELGRCGNSGNSTEPHLHFQGMNTPRLFGATSLPIFFSKVRVRNTPEGTIKEEYEGRKDDIIRNE